MRQTVEEAAKKPYTSIITAMVNIRVESVDIVNTMVVITPHLIVVNVEQMSLRKASLLEPNGWKSKLRLL